MGISALNVVELALFELWIQALITMIENLWWHYLVILLVLKVVRTRRLNLLVSMIRHVRVVYILIIRLLVIIGLLAVCIRLLSLIAVIIIIVIVGIRWTCDYTKNRLSFLNGWILYGRCLFNYQRLIFIFHRGI